MTDTQIVESSTWLSYAQLAQRLGLPNRQAAVARARRGRWPKRTRDTTGEVEVLVPELEIPAGASLSVEPTPDLASPPVQAPSLVEAVQAATASFREIMDFLLVDLRAARATCEALRAELATTQAIAAERQMKLDVAQAQIADANATMERELADRRALSLHVENALEDKTIAEGKTARLLAEANAERLRWQEAALEMEIRVRRELEIIQQRKRLPWWPF